MASSKNLYTVNGTYYLRRRYPKDLAHLYPRPDVRESLRTNSKREAEAKLHVRMAELDAEWKAKREELKRAEKLREYAHGEAFRKARAEARSVGVQMPSMLGDSMRWEDGKLIWSAPEGDADPNRAVAWIDQALAEIEYERKTTTLADGFLPDDQEPNWVVPARHLKAIESRLEELWSAEEAKLQAIKREIETQGQNRTKAGEDRLEALLKSWDTERQVSAETLPEAKRAIREFEATCGPLSYNAIGTDHVRAFKEHLLASGRKAATTKKLWNLLHAIMEHAHENSVISSNPFDGISFNPRNDSVDREDLTREDMEALFKTMSCKSEEWWLWRIALYSGARLSEIHGLKADDVRKEDGVWTLDFLVEGSRRLKTSNSRRKVPVHAQLIRDGLTDWVSGKSGPLFSGTSDAASKRLNKRLRNAGVKARTKTLHSARHTFKSACRHVGLSEDVHDRLTGHASTRAGRKYGEHSLASLKAAIDKVAYGIETAS